ncbi:MAG: hypothetical protein AAF805_02240 [Planctomycetota bacterium]
MLLTAIFLIATVNLAVGYALGARLTPATLQARLSRRSAAPLDDLDDEAPLTRPAEVAEETVVQEPEEPPADVAQAEAAEPPAPPPATPAEMMRSLATFREKLSAASVELKLSQEDPDQFDACASKLQTANHEYLEQAEGAVKTLGELGEQGDTVAAATRDAVANGTEAVADLSGKIDGLIDGGIDTVDGRKELISRAEAIRDTAGQVEGATERAITKAEAAREPSEPEKKSEEPPAEAPRAVTTESIDQLFDKLGVALEAAADDNPTHLAAVQIDPLGEHEQDAMLRGAVQRAIGRVLGESLDEGQSYHCGDSATAVLVGDTYEDAVARVERVRQQISAITFQTPNAEVRVTVTCGLADARSGDPREQITEQLRQAIEESQAAGTNQSFHHDGAFPTPIETQPHDAKPMTIPVG